MRLAIRAVEPLDALENVCEHQTGQRTTALMLLANVFAESLELVERVRGLPVCSCCPFDFEPATLAAEMASPSGMWEWSPCADVREREAPRIQI